MIKVKHLFISILMAAATLPVCAWDCFEAHPTINRLAFEHFLARLKSGHFKEKFKNFAIDDEVKFSGETFSKAFSFESGAEKKTVNANMTFSEWLARGGRDADMPEVNMGFRHFYDPVYEPHYLTWMRRHLKKPSKKKFSSEEEYFKSLDYRADDWNPNIELGTKDRKFKLQPKILRPQIDAITWAFEHEENQHNWNQGKLAYKAAMENDTSAFGNLTRSQMFGKAFRALGETMHLMADMAQPAHTRADSHSVYEPIEKSVNEELIRKIIGSRHKSAEFKPVPEFEIENGLAPSDLMKKLATFTNKHFFSNDTIFDYEKWVFPRNNKRPYPSPQLSRLKHEAGIYYAWFETVGWVAMAKETGSPFSKVLIDNDKFGRKKPHFNVMPNMAESQAKVLMPLAIYNCAELIKAFLPNLRIEFSARENGPNQYRINGELIHDTSDDEEWQASGEIRYNGPAYLQVNNEYLKCEIKDGRLVEKITTLKSGDKIRLVVRAGGIIVAGSQQQIP